MTNVNRVKETLDLDLDLDLELDPIEYTDLATLSEFKASKVGTMETTDGRKGEVIEFAGQFVVREGQDIAVIHRLFACFINADFLRENILFGKEAQEAFDRQETERAIKDMLRQFGL